MDPVCEIQRMDGCVESAMIRAARRTSDRIKLCCTSFVWQRTVDGVSRNKSSQVKYRMVRMGLVRLLRTRHLKSPVIEFGIVSCREISRGRRGMVFEDATAPASQILLACECVNAVRHRGGSVDVVTGAEHFPESGVVIIPVLTGWKFRDDAT